jgi:glucan biosynthesis protein C
MNPTALSTASASIPLEYNQNITRKKTARLYYMDWLRVLAFGLLIFVHCAEVFSNWKYFINNPETSVTLGYVLKFFAQWRMPLLFIVSGAAVVLSLKDRPALQFINERTVRIIIPLIAGMLFVIPPQIYFSWLNQGFQESFTVFYSKIIDFKWFPNGNFHWLHLWYLAFIFIYTLLILPVLLALRNEKGAALIDKAATIIANPAVLFVLPVIMSFPFYCIDAVLPNSNPSQLAYFFPYFIFGVFFANNVQIHETFRKYRFIALIIGTLLSILLYLFFWIKDSSGQTYLSFGLATSQHKLVEKVLVSLNQWQWLIVIWGFAVQYLNKGSKFLTYANQAVFPFYIFHQTLIVIIAYYVIQMEIDIFAKFLIVLTLTLLGMWLLFETFKRTAVTRAMFGMKIKQGK